MSKEPKIYKTADTDVAAYLIYEGIKLIDLEVVEKIIYFNFLDEKKNANDLERVYLNSTFKRFRDIHRYLLKQIHIKLKNPKIIT